MMLFLVFLSGCVFGVLSVVAATYLVGPIRQSETAKRARLVDEKKEAQSASILKVPERLPGDETPAEHLLRITGR